MTISTAELFKKAKKIEIASRRLVDQQLAGQYHSVFKGRGLIFSDVEGGLLRPDTVSHAWQRVVRTKGLPAVTFHALRHTHVSMLLRALQEETIRKLGDNT